MPGKVTCDCGKEYTWKPELGGKRAKCKCGAVVSFPATDPAEDAPEGFDDFAIAGDGAPPPPPPPPPSSVVPPPPPAYANLPRGTIGKGATTKAGGFSWKALLNLIIGLAIGGFGVWIFTGILAKEKANQPVTFGRGRRTGFLRLIYSIAGKWGVLALFLLVALMFVCGAIFTMMGKTKSSDTPNE